MIWKDNDNSTCQEASQPWKSGMSSTQPTALEAEQEFTIENGYYTYFGTYQKQ